MAILYSLGAGILIDTLVATCGFYIVMIGGLLHFRKPHYGSRNTEACTIVMYCIGLLLLLCIHGTFLYYSCLTDRYPFLWHMVKVLFYELCIALIVLCCMAIYFLFSTVANFICKMSNNVAMGA